MNIQGIKKVTVIGAGIMGEGIIQNFAQAGLQVNAVARNEQTLKKCMAQVEANLKLFAEFGLLKETPSQVVARIKPVLAQELRRATEGCDLILETIPEVLESKRQVFTELSEICPDIILASNTSSFTISVIAEGMHNPERFVGIHYFNPAHIIPAVEIHRGKQTTDEVVDIAKALMVKVGKKPVLVQKEIPGFIVNRITGAMEREIDYLLDEGIVSPEDLDIALRGSFGFRLACFGPMEAEDLIGLDTAARVSGRVFKVLSNRTEPSPQLLAKVERGELGIKSGKGWYDYTSKTREQVYDEINRKLLQQLVLYNAREGLSK